MILIYYFNLIIYTNKNCSYITTRLNDQPLCRPETRERWNSSLDNNNNKYYQTEGIPILRDVCAPLRLSIGLVTLRYIYGACNIYGRITYTGNFINILCHTFYTGTTHDVTVLVISKIKWTELRNSTCQLAGLSYRLGHVSYTGTLNIFVLFQS